jgi:integrase
MSVLIECSCHRKQSVRNKICSCGMDLDKLKRSKKTRFWIDNKIPGHGQRREFVGTSIEEARDADSKRKVQKRENRIFDMLPDAVLTFKELADWHLASPDVKKLRSSDRVKAAIDNFNAVFGSSIVSTIKASDLKRYQADREEQGKAAATIDYELSVAKTMVMRAFDDDKVSEACLKAFRRTKKLLKPGANARTRTLSISEYLSLLDTAPGHLQGILILLFNCGMRLSEATGLTWSEVDFAKGFIKLGAGRTKENRPKNIPFNHYVRGLLESLRKDKKVISINKTDRVFTYQGRPLSRDIRKSLATSCKKAGIIFGQTVENGFRLHDIRASVKTHMLEAGVEKAYRDAILGHASTDMDRYYLRISDERLTESMAKYTLWLDGKIEECRVKLGQDLVNSYMKTSMV